MIEGSGSTPLTNGFGSGRPKNMWSRNTGLNFEPYLGGTGEGEGVGGGEAVVAGPHTHIVAHPTALPGIAVRLQATATVIDKQTFAKN